MNGAKLKALRESRGESQQAVAEACGVTRMSIHNLEAGKIKSPTLALAVKLAAHFGLSVQELVDDAEAEQTGA